VATITADGFAELGETEISERFDGLIERMLERRPDRAGGDT